MSHITRNTSHVTRHTSHVTRHTSHVTRHTSHVARHAPHVTRHTSHHRQFGCSVEAARAARRDQRGAQGCNMQVALVVVVMLVVVLLVLVAIAITMLSPPPPPPPPSTLSPRALDRLRNQRKCTVTRSWIIVTTDPAGHQPTACVMPHASQPFSTCATCIHHVHAHHPKPQTPNPQPRTLAVGDCAHPGHKNGMKLQSRRTSNPPKNKSVSTTSHCCITPLSHIARTHIHTCVYTHIPHTSPLCCRSPA